MKPFWVGTLNLLLGDLKIESGGMLVVSSPSSDITADELIKLKDFFSKGGRGIFLIDVQKVKFPNFNDLMNIFGIQIEQSVILEGDSQQFYQEPVYLIPKIHSHTIVDPMVSANLPILFPIAQPIRQLKVKSASIKIEPLLTTTVKSWGKRNLNSSSTEKEAGDIDGPL